MMKTNEVTVYGGKWADTAPYFSAKFVHKPKKTKIKYINIPSLIKQLPNVLLKHKT